MTVEVPLLAGLKSTIAIALQTYAGAAIYQRYISSRIRPNLENLVLGFAIGSAFSTLCDLALRSTTGFAFGWLLPALVLASSSLLTSSTPPITHSPSLPCNKFLHLLPVIVIAFLYLAQDSVWPLWIFTGGVLVWVGIYLQQNSILRIPRWLLFIVGTASICASFFNRPPFWWYIADDFRVFESLSISITKFGPDDSMGALGTLGAEYHFMTYAFSGMIDAIINAPTFLVLSQLMPMLTALLLSATIWVFIERDGGNKKMPNFVLAAMFPLFFDYSFTSPSYCFGLFFYLVSIFFWTDHRAGAKLMFRIPINIVLAIFVVTTKVSNLPTVLAGLAFIAGYGIIRRKEWALIAIINFLTTSVIVLTYFVLFLANSRSESQISSSYAFGFAQRIAGDISTVDDRPTRVLVGMLVTSIFLVLPILGSILCLIHKWKSAPMICLFILPAFPLMLITAFLGGHASSGYFVLSSLNLLNIALIIGVSHYFEHSSIMEIARKRLLLLVTIIILCTYTVQGLQVRSNGGGQNLILLRALLAAHWIPSLAVALIWFLFRGRVLKSLQNLLLFTLIISEIAFFATISYQTKTQLTKGPELTKDQATIAIGAPDQIDAGIWIRNNIPQNAILAANYFCQNACHGANWFEEDYKLLDDTYNFPPSPNGYGGFDMILSLYAERRFLIQGSGFLLVNGMDRNEIRQRMSATLKFANNPNNENLSNIKKFGVTYFVIDRQATERDTWDPYAKEIYRNNTFIVLQFDFNL